MLSYFFPLLLATAGVPLNRDLWTHAYVSDIAKVLGGVWLRTWVQGASAMSNMGMAERAMLPKLFAKRSHYGTPTIGILFSASGVVFLCQH